MDAQKSNGERDKAWDKFVEGAKLTPEESLIIYEDIERKAKTNNVAAKLLEFMKTGQFDKIAPMLEKVRLWEKILNCMYSLCGGYDGSKV